MLMHPEPPAADDFVDLVKRFEFHGYQRVTKTDSALLVRDHLWEDTVPECDSVRALLEAALDIRARVCQDVPEVVSDPHAWLFNCHRDLLLHIEPEPYAINCLLVTRLAHRVFLD